MRGPLGRAVGTSSGGVPAIAPRAALAAGDALLIDLRAPVEFAADHLEGAFNVPLFDDVERALVGTLYARQSPEVAFEAARGLVLEHVDGLVRRIGELAGWKAPHGDLRAIVESITVTVAVEVGRVAPAWMPPPSLAELLPDTVERSSKSSPRLTNTAPPEPVPSELLPTNVEPTTCTKAPSKT